MNLESLGGNRNPYEAKMSGEARRERKEDRMSFLELKREFMKQAVSVFNSQDSLMRHLRELPEFQLAKRNQNFDSENTFLQLAQIVSEELKTSLLIEDQKQQAALLAVLAKLDYMQDEDMLETQSLHKTP